MRAAKAWVDAGYLHAYADHYELASLKRIQVLLNNENPLETKTDKVMVILERIQVLKDAVRYFESLASKDKMRDALSEIKHYVD